MIEAEIKDASGSATSRLSRAPITIRVDYLDVEPRDRAANTFGLTYYTYIDALV
jgi:hypothetical protein